MFWMLFYVLHVSADFGLVTGGIYTGVPLSLDQSINNATCEWQQLGVKWIRIEALWPQTSVQTYQKIVTSAHSAHIKVILVISARFCSDDTNTTAIDDFIQSYLFLLTQLVSSVFVGDAQVDALEIGNELNIAEQGCSDQQTRFRVSPNAFAWLLRRVMQWKENNHRAEKIVSGGLLNTYTTESFWPSFFASGAFFQFSGSLPFDEFGIHPYNPYTIDQQCINSGSLDCFDAWGNDIGHGLTTIASQLATAASVDPSAIYFFVTEVGLTTPTVCNISNCVISAQQQAAGMLVAFSATELFATTTLWYNWRDDIEQFGLRGGWNHTLDNYPPKIPTWNTFARAAGGTGGNPAICWR